MDFHLQRQGQQRGAEGIAIAATGCRITKAIGGKDGGDALVQLAGRPALTAAAEGRQTSSQMVVDRYPLLSIKRVVKDVAQQGERTAKGLAIAQC